MNYLFSKSIGAVATFAAMAVATAAIPAFAVTSPDFPMAGFATQNGGTTGGKGYSEVTVDNVNDLKTHAKAGNKIIYVKPGTYMGPVEVGSNVTIYGYQGAIIAQPTSGSAMKLSGSKNVIIRNLKFKGVGAHDDDDEDCLQVNHESKNVWIDHVDVYDGHDGNLDITNASDFVTISWTKFSYTSASSGHQFSNLIGNSKTKTSDRGHLNVTIHHTWWADGVVERMPRVRFGKVHVANNLFDSKNASYCVRAAVEADIRIERNVFIGVQKALDLYTSDGAITAAQMISNYEENVKKQQAGMGTAFTPPYSMSLTDVSTQAKAYALRDSIKLYAGATLPDPGKTQTVTPASSSSEAASSSSVAVSSSSVAKSSSSVAQSSSSQAVSSSSQGEVVSGTATLTKHGSGSAKQQVKQGESIEEFYFTVAGATGATVTGLPDGIVGTMKGSDFYISGTVAQNAEVGAYNFTVTTTGATTNATKNGTITVVGENMEQGTTSLDVATVAPHFNVSVDGRVLTVQGATQAAYLLDAQGRLITKVQSLGSENSITVPRAGMYLLRVGNEARRVIVR
ncbi:polysaccharide lyase family 1 protein [Fibrobacter sp. UWB12]|uniref:pectate lyase family protein n=1 Tax=Fibrobacter sp. UWB12 TaxID=1896203 RepID=UPI000916A7C1|nr:pectate lyase [Fibrobacter sp. UWB12]SHK62567.1 pectate lyase [Fibrobacter sp. UWB12]